MRHEVFIATKVSQSHFRRDDLIEAANNSLSQLRTDHIDLYQLHWPNPSIPIGETMEAMDRLVDEGKVRFIGVSNFSVAQLQDAEAASRNSIVSNQVPYSLADRRIERELMSYCREHNVTIIAYCPLARGIGNLRRSLKGSVLQKIAQEAGKTEAQVALNWCLSKENVIAIPKSDSVERTEENCRASGWRLSEQQIRLLKEAS